MGKREKEAKGGGAALTPAVPLTVERANFVVDAAAKEADDVVASMQSDGKKPKSLKAATKDAVKELVQTGDPSKVLMYIKGHKKEFISGMYSTVFMSAVRKKMGGDDTPPAAPGAQPPPPAAQAGAGKQAKQGKQEEERGREHKRAKLSQPSDANPSDAKEGGGGGSASAPTGGEGSEKAGENPDSSAGEEKEVSDEAIAPES